jgi:hypothetical protein
MSVSIRIDRLVIDGYPMNAKEQKQLQAAFSSELANQLRHPDLLSRFKDGAALNQLSVPSFGMAAQSSPSHLGREAARSLASSLAPSEIRESKP